MEVGHEGIQLGGRPRSAVEKEEGRAAGVGGAEMDKVDRMRPLASADADTGSELRILVDAILIRAPRRVYERAGFWPRRRGRSPVEVVEPVVFGGPHP